MEGREEEQDQKIPISPRDTAESLPAIEKWRETIQGMQEWNMLPDDLHAGILRRLKTTRFPTEPSGHTSWKHVKTMLRQGRQPDWVDLITATFIWRVKRRRAVIQTTTDLPDTFENEAAFHNPPVDITSWPNKGTAAAWQPREALFPPNLVKPEENTRNTPMPALQAPQAPAAHEGPVPRQATAAPELSAAELTRLEPPLFSGKTSHKRARPAEQEDEADRSQKRRNTINRSVDEAAAGPSDTDDRKGKWADSRDNGADLPRERPNTKKDLADNAQRLADTKKDLENITAEFGELRAIAMNNRRYIRQIVGLLEAITRSQERLNSQLRQEMERLRETMG